MLAGDCWLLVVGCGLLVVGWWLVVGGWWLVVVETGCCWLAWLVDIGLLLLGGGSWKLVVIDCFWMIIK